MKTRIIFAVWIVLAMMLTFARPVSADVLLPNTHHVDWNVKFVNLDQFPGIVLIAQGTRRVTSWPDYDYAVANNEPLTKQYHIDAITIYWNTKDRLNSANRVDSDKSLGVIDPYGGFDYGYVPDSNHLIKKTIEYSLAGFNGTKLMFYQSRTVSEYNDGTPAKEETFENPWANLGLSKTPPSQPPAALVPLPNPPPTVIPPTAQVPLELQSPVESNAPAPNPLASIPSEAQTNGRFWESLSYEQKFLLGLLLTLVVEIPIAVWLVRLLFKRRDISSSRIVLVGLIASGLTLPYLWFILPSFISNSTAYLVVGELSVFLVEVFIYIRLLQLKAKEALVVSLIANTASILVGFALL